MKGNHTLDNLQRMGDTKLLRVITLNYSKTSKVITLSNFLLIV
jgi:hypothetical protein